MKDRLKTAISLAVKSGKLLKENYGNIFQENQKESPRDVVTELDIIAESLIIDSLKNLYPDDSILSEEHGYFPKNENSIWIIDALDGTVNFLNNIPMFCVSIAYWKDQKPLIGVIYNPITSELYYAADGLGAFLNQKKISFLSKPFEQSLSAMSFSGKAFSLENRKKEFKIFGEINDITRGCLRTGSAGLNLCYLSDSRFTLCVGKANKLWDIAAGIVIALQAGAIVNFAIIDDKKYLVDFLAGSNQSINELKANVDINYLKLL
jgi:myo-inositol-1(or 4)-monophosphatase